MAVSFGCLVLLASSHAIALQKNGVAQEERATAKASDASREVTFKINDFRLNTTTGLDSLNGQIILRLTVKNNAEVPLTLEQNQFSFTCADKSDKCNSAVVDPLLPGRLKLEAGESTSGWMGINLSHTSTKEPALSLVWTTGSQTVTLDLNAALRTTSGVKTTMMGPEDCLAVIDLHRPVDQLSTWILTEEFQKLKQLKARNVVLHVQTDPGEKTPQTSYATRTALAAWLGSVQEGQTLQRFAFMTQVKSPVQFSNFMVAGMGSRDATGVSNGSSGNIYEQDRELAIAACVAHVYDRIPLNEALKDLQHAEAGIRRAAIEKNIDRLSAEQLQDLIQQSMSESAAQQALVAENLYRVSMPDAVVALQEFVASDNVEVSHAALTSLVKSASSQAATALKNIWYDAKDKPTMKRDIVSAVMAVSDYRHCDLLTDYARDQILNSAGKNSDVTLNADDEVPDIDSSLFYRLPGSSVLGSNRPETRAVSEAQTLRRILAFLQEQSEVEVLDTARTELLKISDYSIQDVVVDFVLGTTKDRDAVDIARNYIRQRLPGTESETAISEEEQFQQDQRETKETASRTRRITSTLLNTIKRFPDSAYTDVLLTLTQKHGGSSSLARQAFPVVMRCATDAQLSRMIEGFDSLDRYNRPQFLNQLNAINHPQWLSLTKKCLDGDETSWNAALSALRDNGSLEAIMVIVEHLENLRLKAESSPTKGLDTKTYRFADRLIAHLHMCVHPEARRAVNRCERSSVKQLVDLAFNSRRQAFVADPHRAAVANAYLLRREKKYEEARNAYDRILEQDPFYASAYVSRSSLYLREGQPQRAMEDLKRALELDPEDALTESMEALAVIRLGRVDEGIAQMEQIVATVPELQTYVRRDSLYNLACVYGRAIEVEKIAAKREEYTARGMQVLNDCTFREVGFDDVEHITDDPDLNVFHPHPEWSDLLKKIAENEKSSQLKP